MKKLILFALIICLVLQNAYAQTLVNIRSPRDYVTIVNNIQGRWNILNYTKFDFAPKNEPNLSNSYGVNGTVSFEKDLAIIFTDTLAHPQYTIQEIISPKSYLKDYYNMDNDDSVKKAYKVIVSSKIIPVSLGNNNPHYDYSLEFIIVNDDKIFFDQDGIVYELCKVNSYVDMFIKLLQTTTGEYIPINKRVSDDPIFTKCLRNAYAKQNKIVGFDKWLSNYETTIQNNIDNNLIKGPFVTLNYNSNYISSIIKDIRESNPSFLKILTGEVTYFTHSDGSQIQSFDKRNKFVFFKYTDYIFPVAFAYAANN